MFSVHVYLVSATLTGTKTCQDLALYSCDPRVPLVHARSLKVPRLPSKRHYDEVGILFLCEERVKPEKHDMRFAAFDKPRE